MTTAFEPFEAPLIKVTEILKKRIVILDYKIIPGHTKPGGKIGNKKDYVKRHIEILIRYEGKEFKLKSESLNFEKTLTNEKNKLPAETEISRTAGYGVRFSSFRRIRSK